MTTTATPDSWQALADAVVPPGTLTAAWAAGAARDYHRLALREARAAVVAEAEAHGNPLAADLAKLYAEDGTP